MDLQADSKIPVLVKKMARWGAFIRNQTMRFKGKTLPPICDEKLLAVNIDMYHEIEKLLTLKERFDKQTDLNKTYRTVIRRLRKKVEAFEKGIGENIQVLEEGIKNA